MKRKKGMQNLIFLFIILMIILILVIVAFHYGLDNLVKTYLEGKTTIKSS